MRGISAVGQVTTTSPVAETDRVAVAGHFSGKVRREGMKPVMAAKAGLIDSFREAHPDPAKAPGNTWSPVFKTFEDPEGWYGHKGEPEPKDRIDFIYHAGRGLKVLNSKVVVAGNPRPDPVENNVWPSDHAAVLSTFQLS